MQKLAVDDVLALNVQLAALEDLGLPSRLSSVTRGGAERALRQISNNLAVRSELGQSLINAVTENHELPGEYRAALQSGLRSNRLSGVLDGMSRQAAAEDELRSIVWRALLPVLILLGLAYLGFILLCSVYAPTVEGMYTQVGQLPSVPERILLTLREWLPVWTVLVPVLVVAVLYLGRVTWSRWCHLIPGTRRYLSAVRNASFANQLRLLTENNVPLVEGIPLAAEVTGDPTLIAGSTTVAATRAVPPTEHPKSTWPPLLEWVCTHDLRNQSLPGVLRGIEAIYSERAEQQAAVWRVTLPAGLGAVLGGGIVFVYALSTFGPYVELLKDLSQ
jgi:type II secretory pathway component PulF